MPSPHRSRAAVRRAPSCPDRRHWRFAELASLTEDDLARADVHAPSAAVDAALCSQLRYTAEMLDLSAEEALAHAEDDLAHVTADVIVRSAGAADLMDQLSP